MTLLLHWLWQGSALAFGLAMVLRYMRSVNAATRYALWWLALGIVLVLPMVAPVTAWLTAATGPFGHLDSSITTALLTTESAATAGSLITLPAAPAWLVACAVGLWFGSVLVGAGRLVAAVRTVHRLKTESQPIAPVVGRALRLWTATTSRRADLRTSRTIAGACALGLTGRPTIVVSRTLAASLAPDALDLIVLHEQLHLSRYDDWSRLAQSLLVTLFGLHPAVRFISAKLDVEREAACDEAVAVRAGDARRYATCLADVADVITGRRALVAPLAVPNAGGSGLLFTRVQRLLDPGITRHSRLRGAVLTAASLLLATGSVVVTTVAPRFVTEVKMTAQPTLSPVVTAPQSRPATIGSTAFVSPSGTLPTVPVPLTHADEKSRPTRPVVGAGRLPDVGVALNETGVTQSLDAKDELEQAAAPLPSVELPRVTVVAPGTKQNVTADLRSGDNSWAVVGASARRVGLALGSSFGRAGKAVASRF